MGFLSGGFKGALMGGGAGSLAGTVGGIVLAPFTGGASLVIGPMLGGFVGSILGGTIGSAFGLFGDDDDDKPLTRADLKALLGGEEKSGPGFFAGLMQVLAVGAVGMGAWEIMGRENPDWPQPPQFVTNLVGKLEEKIGLVDDNTPQSPRTKVQAEKLAKEYPELYGPDGKWDITQLSELKARQVVASGKSEEGREMMENMRQQAIFEKQNLRDGIGRQELQVLENFVAGLETGPTPEKMSKQEYASLKALADNGTRDLTMQDMMALHKAHKEGKSIQETATSMGILVNPDTAQKAANEMVAAGMDPSSLAGAPGSKAPESIMEGMREFQMISQHVAQEAKQGRINPEETLALLQTARENTLTAEMIANVHNEYSQGQHSPQAGAGAAPTREQETGRG